MGTILEGSILQCTTSCFRGWQARQAGQASRPGRQAGQPGRQIRQTVQAGRPGREVRPGRPGRQTRQAGQAGRPSRQARQVDQAGRPGRQVRQASQASSPGRPKRVGQTQFKAKRIGPSASGLPRPGSRCSRPSAFCFELHFAHGFCLGALHTPQSHVKRPMRFGLNWKSPGRFCFFHISPIRFD